MTQNLIHPPPFLFSFRIRRLAPSGFLLCPLGLTTTPAGRGPPLLPAESNPPWPYSPFLEGAVILLHQDPRPEPLPLLPRYKFSTKRLPPPQLLLSPSPFPPPASLPLSFRRRETPSFENTHLRVPLPLTATPAHLHIPFCSSNPPLFKILLPFLSQSPEPKEKESFFMATATPREVPHT